MATSKKFCVDLRFSSVVTIQTFLGERKMRFPKLWCVFVSGTTLVAGIERNRNRWLAPFRSPIPVVNSHLPLAFASHWNSKSNDPPQHIDHALETCAVSARGCSSPTAFCQRSSESRFRKTATDAGRLQTSLATTGQPKCKASSTLNG